MEGIVKIRERILEEAQEQKQRLSKMLRLKLKI